MHVVLFWERAKVRATLFRQLAEGA